MENAYSSNVTLRPVGIFEDLIQTKGKSLPPIIDKLLGETSNAHLGKYINSACHLFCIARRHNPKGMSSCPLLVPFDANQMISPVNPSSISSLRSDVYAIVEQVICANPVHVIHEEYSLVANKGGFNSVILQTALYKT